MGQQLGWNDPRSPNWNRPATSISMPLALTLGGLRLFRGKLSTDCFHLFARCCSPLPAVWRRHNQLLEAGSKVRSICSADFAEQRLEFREDPNVLPIAVIE